MTVIIGIDPHKATHTAVAIGCDERQLATVRVRATDNRSTDCSGGRCHSASGIQPEPPECPPHPLQKSVQGGFRTRDTGMCWAGSPILRGARLFYQG